VKARYPARFRILMQKFARLAPAVETEIIDMTRPHSNFDFIEARFPELVTLRRLFSLIRQNHGRTIIMERLEPSRDLFEENEDVRQIRPNFSRSTAFRISFFSKSFSSAESLALLTDNELIGYAIIKNDVFGLKHESRIYESVLRPPHHPNNFVKREPVWRVRVGKKIYRIKGHLYAQQNGITNCCGHVAVRTAAACFGGKDMSYREMNRILGINLKKRTPGDGIELAEMVKLLRRAGARCFEADYRARPTTRQLPFQKYVYGSIESGYPAIISFQTTNDVDSYHAIPIFGHTFNSDTWVPSAERLYFQVGAGTRYIPSESWVSMYIGHDDNWDAHYCIPRHYFQTQHPTQINARDASPKLGECVAHVISTVPKKVHVSPIRAEVIAADYLFALRRRLARLRRNVWASRLNKHTTQNLVVLRPILVTTSEYCSHLRCIRDWNHKRIDAGVVSALEGLPNTNLWMVEVSLPELFSANLRKVGEVLVRAEKRPGPGRLGGFFLARLPGYFALLREIKRGKPRFTFIPSGADGHVELFGCEENE
jgi:hypothetical protein